MRLMLAAFLIAAFAFAAVKLADQSNLRAVYLSGCISGTTRVIQLVYQGKDLYSAAEFAVELEQLKANRSRCFEEWQ